MINKFNNYKNKYEKLTHEYDVSLKEFQHIKKIQVKNNIYFYMFIYLEKYLFRVLLIWESQVTLRYDCYCENCESCQKLLRSDSNKDVFFLSMSYSFD